MPARQDYMLSTPVIADDRASLKALQEIGGYAPRNAAYGVEALAGAEAALKQAELATEAARLALEEARRRQILAGWTFHNGMQGAKAELNAQFGPESEPVRAVNMTRKTNRKRAAQRRATSQD